MMKTRAVLVVLTTVFLTVSSLEAGLSLNPLSWFSATDEASIDPTRIKNETEQKAVTQLEKGRQKYEAGRHQSAQKIFKKIGKKYPLTEAAGEARFLHAQIRMQRGQFNRAHALLQEIVFQNPDFPKFEAVISNQFLCATALMEGARSKILFIFPGFKQYSEAMRQFEFIVANAPYGDYAPIALMNIALIAEDQNEAEIAIDALDRLINYYPQSILASDAYYHLANTYANLVKSPEYDQGSTRQAISYYEDFLALFPDDPNVGEVESNLAQMQNILASSRKELGDFFYLYRNNNTAALTFYNEAITIAVESETAEEARQRIKDIEAGVRPVTGSKLLGKVLRSN
ncbi:MAG: Outer membrane protein assembly factor BamD [Opitutia bacterium UBA7350]|nr:MAG: Outer membrane protein assembly factor BamD [Opitutae bacterium UBA7350]